MKKISIEQLRKMNLEQLKILSEKVKIDNYIDKIFDSFLLLSSLERQGVRASKYEIINAFESLEGIFQPQTTEKLLELTRQNHVNSEEILYVGAKYFLFKGDNAKALEFYNNLADYYKMHGQINEHKQCVDIIKKIST